MGGVLLAGRERLNNEVDLAGRLSFHHARRKQRLSKLGGLSDRVLGRLSDNRVDVLHADKKVGGHRIVRGDLNEGVSRS
jgi:hypothetical protein